MKIVKRNLDRIILWIVLLSLIGILALYLCYTLRGKEELPSAKNVDKIAEFNYYLDDNDSELYRNCFVELKEVLNNDINYDEYAKLLSSLFVIDFYTLDNKVTNMDIGGLQYLYPDIKDNFILKASDTIYKNVKSNIYGDRDQKLPIVTDVEIISIENVTFEYENTIDKNAYKIFIYLDYQEDLGYPNEVELTVIHVDKKLAIVEVN